MNTPRGITLVEVLIATAVLGVLGVASLQASAVAASLRRGTAERLAMSRQCEALIDTALALPYDDLVVADATLEVEAVSGGGDAVSGGAQTRVAISYVDPDDPSTVVGSDMGLKLIVVQITKNGRNIARVHALRSRASDRALP
jgi:prepilin-type N-terminal cleavage/methylation domain-containing protein